MSCVLSFKKISFGKNGGCTNFHKRPYNPNKPLVSLEEKLLQLLDHVKLKMPIMKKVQANLIDYEYILKVEPNTGRTFKSF